MKVDVIGAGPIGARSAIELARNGHEITLYSEYFPGEGKITGDKAVGIGCRYRPDSPNLEKAFLDSVGEFMNLARDPNYKPVVLTDLTVKAESAEIPEWADHFRNYAVLSEDKARYEAYSFDPAELGKWRLEELASLGGKIRRHKLTADDIKAINDRENPFEGDKTVVAMGLGEKETNLGGALFPIRGLLVHFPDPTDRKLEIGKSYMNEFGSNSPELPFHTPYCISRPGEVVIGGTYEEHTGYCSDDEAEKIGEKIIKLINEETGSNYDIRDEHYITQGLRPGGPTGGVVERVGEKIVRANEGRGQGHCGSPAIAKKVTELVEE